MDKCGGIYIYYEFEKFLENIVGDGILKSFAKDCLEDYLDMLDHFKIQKQSSAFSDVIIRFPRTFIDLVKKKYKGGLKEALHSSIYKGRVRVICNKLKIPIEEFQKFFHETIKKIVNFIYQYLNDTIEFVIIVGRLADCQIVQYSIQNSFNFETSMIVIPDKAELTVLKGAVVNGYIPNKKSSRTQCIAFK